MTPQMRYACWAGLFIPAFLVPVHGLAANAQVQPMACTTLQASMGSFYRWPTPNPGMVAPVLLIHNYPVYSNPLSSSFTGKSIEITIPPNFGATAGFHLGKTAIPAATDERYRLTRIELRKPAVAYTGLGQALSHVMEMVLVHKEENGNRWANVILPFQVSTNGADVDIINPIIDGAKLPSRIGQSGYVMASAVGNLLLSPGFDNATFSEFWSKAPVAGCNDKNVNVRFFMRTNTLAIGIDTFAQLSNALENVPEQEPTQPPEGTWIMSSCKNSTGTCVVQKPVDMQAKLKSAQGYQTQALTEQRTRKADLDAKLAQLKTHTGSATTASIGVYEGAMAAYTDLRSSASELVSAEDNVMKIQKFATEAASAKWDADAPSATATSAPSAASPSAAPHPQAGASFVDAGQQSSDCSALGQSPVDIDTKRVVDPSAVSPALIEPLAFRYMSSTNERHAKARLRFSHNGRHLRVAVPSGSVEWPLGGVLSRGVLRGVSYVDIHVPGEHSVDGRLPAAELQLVHESAGGRPAMAVAVPLEVSPGEGEENEWLKPLLQALPEKSAAKNVLGQPLGLLHTALSSGMTSHYYRYDGSLTKPPCLLTEWFILEEPGHLSQQQLSALSAALDVGGAQGATQLAHSPFLTSLVMKGSPRLVGQVTDTAGFSPENLGKNFLSKFRARRRVAV